MSAGHFRCEIKVHSRSEGANAVGRAAYRAGLNLDCERTGERFYFGYRADVLYSKIFLPPGAPSDYSKPPGLWNAAEKSETRINSRVAREALLALPAEFSAELREKAVEIFSTWLVRRYRVGVHSCIHDAKPKSPLAFHAHVLFTSRQIGLRGFGKKTRVLDDKKSGSKETKLIRRAWALIINSLAARFGYCFRVSHKSYQDRGIDRRPTKKLGLKSTYLESIGIETETGNYNRLVRKERMIKKHLEQQMLIDQIRAQRSQKVKQPKFLTNTELMDALAPNGIESLRPVAKVEIESTAVEKKRVRKDKPDTNLTL